MPEDEEDEEDAIVCGFPGINGIKPIFHPKMFTATLFVGAIFAAGDFSLSWWTGEHDSKVAT